MNNNSVTRTENVPQFLYILEKYAGLIWIFLGFVFCLLLSDYKLATISFAILGYVATKKIGEGRNRKDAALSVREDAHAFIEQLKSERKLPTIPSALLLDEGERVIFEESTTLKETRAIRHSIGVGMGTSIMKGVRVGTYKSRSESKQEWRLIDTGKLVLTNKRIIFNGEKENRAILVSQIISIEAYRDGIELSIKSKTKGTIFSVSNPYIWNIAIRIIHSVKDPFNLEGMELNIEIE